MAEGSSLQDDELYLPRTVVNKLIKEMVPNIRVSTDARDLLLNCCSEFIHLVASEANEVSERQQKKVITPEHVIEALMTLGFQEYVEDVKTVHKEYKEQASKHRKRGKSKLDRLGIPEEELARQQQQLFDEARQQHLENELLEQQRQQQQQLAAGAMGVTTTPPSQLTPSTVQQSIIGAAQQHAAAVTSKQMPVKSPPQPTQQEALRATLQQHVQAMSSQRQPASVKASTDTAQVSHTAHQQPKATQQGGAATSLPPIAPLPMPTLIHSSPALLQQAMTAMAAQATTSTPQSSQMQAANMAQFMLLAQQAMKTSQLMQAMQQQQQQQQPSASVAAPQLSLRQQGQALGQSKSPGTQPQTVSSTSSSIHDGSAETKH